MLIPQQARSERRERQGRRDASLAELRRRLTEPSALNSAHRQRLQDLVRRLARVQALGDEYARIEFSEVALKAASHAAVAAC